MKDLNVVVYTMKGCPFCTDFKEMLVNEGLNSLIEILKNIKKNMICLLK
jgi:glutaredoxin